MGMRWWFRRARPSETRTQCCLHIGNIQGTEDAVSRCVAAVGTASVFPCQTTSTVSPSQLQLAGIEERYGSEVVLPGIDLTIEPGQVVSLIGPSGCGKSTLLAVAAGLIRPDGGTVALDGVDVTGRPGSIAYMPQRDLLLPWHSVAGNVALGLTIQGRPRADALAAARALLDRVGLGEVADADPRTLSGGMRQRAAVARTLAQGRGVILLDEPFGALDHITRTAVHDWLLEVWWAEPTTVLCVTHDTREAVLLADRVLVMEASGRIAHDIPVPLPHPRNAGSSLTDHFVAIERDLRARLIP